eukprot:jgi/Tetstr1/425556/TSEL_015979.t1
MATTSTSAPDMATKGSRTLARPARALREALCCDLCAELLREATTATECCHTFCRSCIDSRIHIGGTRNICPVCGDDIILGPDPYVHRKLQYDTSLDDLVRQVFPRADDAARMEARQEREQETRHARTAAGLPAKVETNFRRPLNFDDSQRAPQLGSAKRKAVASPSNNPRAQSSPRVAAAALQLGLPKSTKAPPSKRPDAVIASQLVLVMPAAGPAGGSDPPPALWRPYLHLSRLVPVETLLKYIGLETGLDPEQLELACMGKAVAAGCNMAAVFASHWAPSNQCNPVMVINYREKPAIANSSHELRETAV